MMKTLIVFILVLSASVSFSCHRDPLDVKTKGIDAEVKIARFDRELFEYPGDLSVTIDSLYRAYGDFFEIFSYNIISIGQPSEITYEEYLRMFLNDGLNREVYKTTRKAFPDLKKEEEVLSAAFKRYKYHFREGKLPRIVAFVSRFNNPCFTVSDYIGVGLDMYLGVSHPYYKQLDIPQYQKENMFREKIPSDLMYAWASALFPYTDSVNNVLSHLIYQGKLMYFVEAMLPDQPEGLLAGYDKNQRHWVVHNARMMWTYLIEQKLLFSEDEMAIRRLTGPAPYTYYFTSDSPGRAGIWIGWQIIREYVKHNPGVSLKELMQDNDYERILRLSKYNP